MTNPVCPRCAAELDADLIASTGKARCPYCSADLTSIQDQFHPAESDSQSFSAERAEHGAPMSLPGLPAGSKIRVVEATETRYLIQIPPGGKKSVGLGCMAVFWNGIVIAVTAGVLSGAMAGDTELLFVLAFLSIFWIAGLGLAYGWAVLKYTRYIFLLEPDRLVMQKLFLGSKKITETELDQSSRASLKEAYSENDVPVYKIEIKGTNRSESFGTALTDAEKDWLVDRINEFLGAPALDGTVTMPAFCPHCGQNLAGIVPKGDHLICPQCRSAIEPILSPGSSPLPVEPVEPQEVNRPGLQLLEQGGDVLRFRLPLFEGGEAFFRILVIVIGVVAGVMAGGFMVSMLGWFLQLVPPWLTWLVYPAVAVAVFLLSRAMLRDPSIDVTLGPDEFRVRWGTRWLGYTARQMSQSINSVRVAYPEPSPSLQAKARRQQNPSVATHTHRLCTVSCAGKNYYLTLNHDEATARQVAGLLLWQLDRLHIPVG